MKRRLKSWRGRSIGVLRPESVPDRAGTNRPSDSLSIRRDMIRSAKYPKRQI